MELQGKRGQRWRKRQNSQENLAKWKENTKKRKENTWETQKTKKIPKKNKKNSKINLAPHFHGESYESNGIYRFPSPWGSRGGTAAKVAQVMPMSPGAEMPTRGFLVGNRKAHSPDRVFFFHSEWFPGFFLCHDQNVHKCWNRMDRPLVLQCHKAEGILFRPQTQTLSTRTLVSCQFNRVAPWTFRCLQQLIQRLQTFPNSLESSSKDRPKEKTWVKICPILEYGDAHHGPLGFRFLSYPSRLRFLFANSDCELWMLVTRKSHLQILMTVERMKKTPLQFENGRNW